MSKMVNIEIALGCSLYEPIGEAIRYKHLFKYASQYELIDRLYRRYVRYEDIDATQRLVEQIFDEIQFDKALRNDFTYAYEQCIEDVKEDAGKNGEHYGEGGNYCHPIRILNVTGIHTDMSPMPEYMAYISAEGEIPLEDYDNLEGNPFWMRPEYVVEKYL